MDAMGADGLPSRAGFGFSQESMSFSMDEDVQAPGLFRLRCAYTKHP